MTIACIQSDDQGPVELAVEEVRLNLAPQASPTVRSFRLGTTLSEASVPEHVVNTRTSPLCNLAPANLK